MPDTKPTSLAIASLALAGAIWMLLALIICSIRMSSLYEVMFAALGVLYFSVCVWCVWSGRSSLQDAAQSTKRLNLAAWLTVLPFIVLVLYTAFSMAMFFGLPRRFF